MQISNPAISQLLSGTINRSQQPDRFPVKSTPVRSEPLEGQLVDDKRDQSEANKTQDSGFSNDLEQSENGSQTQLITPADAPQVSQALASERQGGALLIQQKLNSQPAVLSQNKESQSEGPQNEESQTTQIFPFGNRRSFEGVSGSSLVVQKYLTNESPALTQSGNPQRNVDIFI